MVNYLRGAGCYLHYNATARTSSFEKRTSQIDESRCCLGVLLFCHEVGGRLGIEEHPHREEDGGHKACERQPLPAETCPNRVRVEDPHHHHQLEARACNSHSIWNSSNNSTKKVFKTLRLVHSKFESKLKVNLNASHSVTPFFVCYRRVIESSIKYKFYIILYV